MLFHKKVVDYSFKVKGLRVSYHSKEVLKGISFTVRKKDIFGIIGLSGSGKTTLLKALMGFIRHKGDILKGYDRIGYCPQGNAFFKELTIKENIMLFGNLNSVSAGKSMSRAVKLMKELLIREPLEKLAGKLSGGQQKRLNIILSILHDPDTIILDEPFAGLDYVNRLLLWRFIRQLRGKGKTVVLTTHLLGEAQHYCNNILVVSDGKRFASGSISDIKRSLKFRRFLRLKFNYLSNAAEEKIINYCRERGIKILELSENAGAFGLKQAADRQNLLSMIKRHGVKVRIDEYRVPSLNELFMVSVK